MNGLWKFVCFTLALSFIGGWEVASVAETGDAVSPKGEPADFIKRPPDVMPWDPWLRGYTYVPAQEFFDRTDERWAVVNDAEVSVAESYLNTQLQSFLVPLGLALEGPIPDDVEKVFEAFNRGVDVIASKPLDEIEKLKIGYEEFVVLIIDDLRAQPLFMNSLEYVVYYGRGECRDFVDLLLHVVNRLKLENSRIRRIDSPFGFPGHVWARMEMRDPEMKLWTQFDLDPVQYAEFSPLKPRWER